ncbi:MAG: phenylalanine--tRNA ligase subunit beta [Nanoarchaeota archaeon]
MAGITFKKSEIERYVKLTPEIIEKINLLGTTVENNSDEWLTLEILPNRPDLLSAQGFGRALSSFLGKETGLKKYPVKKPEANYKVIIDSSVKQVRPFTVCAIVKNIKLDEEKIRELIDLQEKLHTTIGRNRKKLAIGIYPLEKISLPINYIARPPKDIWFTPLDSQRELNGLQILQQHPTGRKYAHLLEKEKLFPVFVDSKNKILSMPPIINSNDTGKITLDTNEVFIECSGFDLRVLNKVLNIITTTLAECSGTIYSMICEYSKSNKIITPDLKPEKMKISLENTNKILGLNLKEKDLQKLLPKMGYDYENKTAYIPAWRTDILHEVDIIEDIAIAYGYNNLVPEIPKVATTGQESDKSILQRKVSEILAGLGLIEISSYHLIRPEEAKNMKIHQMVELENAKTEYKVLRPNLLISALRILSENKDHEYPQKIFEIGTIFSHHLDKESETQINEESNLTIAVSPGNFTEIKKILDYLTRTLDLKYELKEKDKHEFIPGRLAQIIINNTQIGTIGEIHPETLILFNMKMPVAVLEINLDKIIELVK